MVEFVRLNGTGLHQGDSLEKYKEDNLAKANCLKLQTQENLLKCFHQLTKTSKNKQKYGDTLHDRNNVDISTSEIASKKV